MKVGRHLSISKGLGFADTPHRAKERGCNALQVFLGSPQAVEAKERKHEELVAFAACRKDCNDMYCVVHSAYTINLCYPVGSDRHVAGVASIVRDLRGAAVMGAAGTVVHMGKNVAGLRLTDEQAAINYAVGIEEALKASGTGATKIILETAAGQGTEQCVTLEKLGDLYRQISEEARKRVAFCVDTCHVWAAGYDIGSAESVRQFFEKFDQCVGGPIECIHFNGSLKHRGCRVDRHTAVAGGTIPIEGMKAVARYAEEKQIPLIVETPCEGLEARAEIEAVRAMVGDRHEIFTT